jgi:hypothetical protein
MSSPRTAFHSPCLGFDATLDFHLYTIDWHPDSISWSVDGRIVHQRVSWDPTPIPHLPMRLQRCVSARNKCDSRTRTNGSRTHAKLLGDYLSHGYDAAAWTDELGVGWKQQLIVICLRKGFFKPLAALERCQWRHHHLKLPKRGRLIVIQQLWSAVTHEKIELRCLLKLLNRGRCFAQRQP